MKPYQGMFRTVLSAASFVCSVMGQPAGVTGPPTVQIVNVPPSNPGGPDRMEPIAGTVEGDCADCRIVVFARGDVWYVQPWANAPFTALEPNHSWHTDTHLGTQYAAVLVRRSYQPPARVTSLPPVGSEVLAVTIVDGRRAIPEPGSERNRSVSVPKTLDFAGYVWEIKSSTTRVGPGPNYFAEENAWVDPQGRLHLRVSRQGDRWLTAEVISKESLGYGTYTFEVADTSQLPPEVVLGLFTWDTQANQYHNREIDIEVSRWGDPNNDNLQCVVQPYTVPENIVRYNGITGPMIHSFQWKPGVVRCRSLGARDIYGRSPVIFEHTFTTGVPSAGSEQVRINLWIVGGKPSSNMSEAEVVITTFRFRPE